MYWTWRGTVHADAAPPADGSDPSGLSAGATLAAFFYCVGCTPAALTIWSAVPLMRNLEKLDSSWTLVLPPFRQFGQSVWEKWSDMFDGQKLKGLLPGLQRSTSKQFYEAWENKPDV